MLSRSLRGELKKVLMTNTGVEGCTFLAYLYNSGHCYWE